MGLIADLCCFAMVQVIYSNNREIPMSAHYKLPWFVSRVSPASPHLSYSQRHWLVSFQPFLSFRLWLTATMASSPYAFVHTHYIYAYVQASVSSNITIFKHALLRNPRYHHNCSFHSIPRFFCSSRVCCLHFSTQGSPF